MTSIHPAYAPTIQPPSSITAVMGLRGYQYDNKSFSSASLVNEYFTERYLEITSLCQPKWKTLFQKKTLIMPQYHNWIKRCIDLNMLLIEADFYRTMVKTFHRLGKKSEITSDSDMLEIMKNNPSLYKSIIIGISEGKIQSYEATLLYLLLDERVKNNERLWSITALEANHQQIEDYLSMPQHYLNALM